MIFDEKMLVAKFIGYSTNLEFFYYKEVHVYENENFAAEHRL